MTLTPANPEPDKRYHYHCGEEVCRCTFNFTFAEMREHRDDDALEREMVPVHRREYEDALADNEPWAVKLYERTHGK